MKMSDQVFVGKEGKPKAIFGECEAARIVEKLLSEDESKSINGFLQQCWFLVLIIFYTGYAFRLFGE